MLSRGFPTLLISHDVSLSLSLSLSLLSCAFLLPFCPFTEKVWLIEKTFKVKFDSFKQYCSLPAGKSRLHWRRFKTVRRKRSSKKRVLNPPLPFLKHFRSYYFRGLQYYNISGKQVLMNIGKQTAEEDIKTKTNNVRGCLKIVLENLSFVLSCSETAPFPRCIQPRGH